MLPSKASQFKSAAVILLSPRDRDLLLLLDRTPATTPLIVKASTTFTGGSYGNERRARERLQQLSHAGLVRSWKVGQPSGAVTNCYKLTPSGFATLRGEETAPPPRAYFSEIPLSRVEHTLTLAEIIVHTLVSAHRQSVEVAKFHRENELTLAVGQYVQQPDCHFQLSTGGKAFNLLFEIDRSTESVDSFAEQSIRQKLLGYEAYQDMVMQQWRDGGGQGIRPAFRVVFLTVSVQRAYHILSVARELARNPHRRLCYAATYATFLADEKAVCEPLFLDHFGGWQALVNVHPSSTFLREPVRLPTRVQNRPLL
jgi:hypothetical protein